MTSYYADCKRGNDGTGDGTELHPWKTISKFLVECENLDILVYQEECRTLYEAVIINPVTSLEADLAA